ncbi:MAG: tRNA (N6-isopentenyl adenosine(37)-C2)-methylthiotransferase MiaB [Acidobacteriota bacterium]
MNRDQDKKYQILTYGCQMNERDSEIIAGLLETAGYEQAKALEDADLVVFNTCSVRHSAENKVFSRLGEIKKLKYDRPELKVAFGGCMAQLPEVRRRLSNLGVDVVFGTHNVHELPGLLEQAYLQGGRIFRVWDKAGEVVENLPSKRERAISSFVNIMYGCNNYCSYCIVPYVRGQERSRESGQIIDEIKSLVDNGTKEVTLLGQNVNSYGRGLEGQIDFADLLEKVNRIDGLDRIRFMTSHPRDMNDRLIEAIAKLDKVCEHVHAPLQAGSNKTLKLMNRGYTREYYSEMTDKIKAMIPGVAISSDFIVGFPGEDDEDFEQTLEMVRKIKFDAAFTFIYSKRTGTKACDMDAQVPREVKVKRLMQLNEIQYNIALEHNKRHEGQVVELLVEGSSKTVDTKLTGRTRTNRIVVFEGPSSLEGKLVQVKVTEAKTFTLFGTVLEGNRQ